MDNKEIIMGYAVTSPNRYCMRSTTVCAGYSRNDKRKYFEE
jgi:hypothetical protein